MLDRGVGDVDDPVIIEVVIRVLILDFQTGRLTRIELETRRLEPEQELARVEDRDGDQDRITGLEGSAIRLAEQRIAGLFEAQEVVLRIRRCGRLIVEPQLAAFADLGPETALQGDEGRSRDILLDDMKLRIRYPGSGAVRATEQR